MAGRWKHNNIPSQTTSPRHRDRSSLLADVVWDNSQLDAPRNAYLKVPGDVMDRRNRNGAVVGLAGHTDPARELVRRWRACALIRECIAPPNASSRNHRYDQALLSILFYNFMPKGLSSMANEPLDISTHNDKRSIDEVRDLLKEIKEGRRR